MDYTKTQHKIKQSTALAVRQMQAFQYFAPQADAGSLLAAEEADYEFRMNNGSSHERGD